MQSDDVIGTFMNECVNSYATVKNILQSLTHAINTFVTILYAREKKL